MTMKKLSETMWHSYPWWDDCKMQVRVWIFQDMTTTKDDLYEKIRSYASNYFASNGISDISLKNREEIIDEMADELTLELQSKSFDQRPPAGVVAQYARNSVGKRPEDRLVKFEK